MDKIKELENRIVELENMIKVIYNSSDIPHDVEQAFRTRFQLERVDTLATITTSSKGATTENQAVNEGGVATYSVMKPPDAFIEITINGNLKYIPIFT